AMELEFQIAENETDCYEYRIRDGEPMIVDWEPMMRAILDEVRMHASNPVIAAKFHNTLAAIVVEVARRVGEPRVVLTGGCFQNRYLTEHVVQHLTGA